MLVFLLGFLSKLQTAETYFSCLPLKGCGLTWFDKFDVSYTLLLEAGVPLGQKDLEQTYA